MNQPPRAGLPFARFGRLPAIAIFTMLLGLLSGPVSLLPSAAGAQEVPIEAVSRTEGEYFAETGHNLKGAFLAHWKTAGGEDAVGLPLSEERYAEGAGGVLQTFEGLTLIYDPSLDEPWDIQGQHLPSAVRREQASATARREVSACPANANTCRFFPESGHSVSGRILRYWEDGGDLPIFGLPLSEPFREDGANIQLFERVVIEDHGDGEVRLRALGQESAEELIGSDPAFLPAPPTGGTARLVHAEDGLRLRGGPSLEAEIRVVLPDSAEFITAPGGSGDWVPGYADGYAGWVSADFLRTPPPLPTIAERDWNPGIWQGAALGETNVRAEPTTAAPIVQVLAYGDPVTVTAWVKGEEVFEGADMWAQVGPSAYIYSRNVGRNAPVEPPPLPADAPTSGRWIDVDLTQQLMTAYEGRKPVRTVPTTTGMAGWETPTGRFQILSRVGNETMTSGAIGAENHYKLEDVLFTQYFTDQGHAIHFAWWRTPETIGRPGSHGCLNLLLDDARFFWDWADIGTPLYIHN